MRHRTAWGCRSRIWPPYMVADPIEDLDAGGNADSMVEAAKNVLAMEVMPTANM